jgi:hypothetical protein
MEVIEVVERGPVFLERLRDGAEREAFWATIRAQFADGEVGILTNRKFIRPLALAELADDIGVDGRWLADLLSAGERLLAEVADLRAVFAHALKGTLGEHLATVGVERLDATLEAWAVWNRQVGGLLSQSRQEWRAEP